MLTNQFPPAQRAPKPNPAFRPPSARPMVTSMSGVAMWLDEQERQFTHPEVVKRELIRAGWFPQHAAIEAARYRDRFNEHPLGYAALLVSTGVGALALGTVGHTLTAAVGGTIDRNELGFWLTVFLVSMPFLAWAHWWAAAVDRRDPVAVWSNPRRSLSRALLWGCGIVGIGRLLWYGAQLVGALVGATWAAHASIAAGLVNVAITVGIALPLGLWAFRFRHRFDEDDPTVSRFQRRQLGH